MALSDFAAALPSAEVPYAGKTFTVWNLDWAVLEPLIHDFWDDISAVVDKVRSGDEDADFMVEILGLVRKLPHLEARIIAEAAREPDMVNVVRHLPLPVRTQALVEIARLTFVDIEEAKKMLGTLQGLFSVAQTMMPAPSED